MSHEPHLTLLPGRFAVCRLDPSDSIAPIESGPFFSITRTGRETSIVCLEEDAPARARVEEGWSCLEVEGPIEFATIGVVAGISKALADAGVSLFVVSTFDTDYVLVKEGRIDAAIEALESAGYVVSRP